MDQVIREARFVFEKPCPHCNFSPQVEPGEAPVDHRFSVKPEGDMYKIPAQPLNPAWKPWLDEVFRLEEQFQVELGVKDKIDGCVRVSAKIVNPDATKFWEEPIVDLEDRAKLDKALQKAVDQCKHLAPPKGTPKYIDCPYCKDGIMPLEKGDENLYPEWMQRWARRILDEAVD